MKKIEVVAAVIKHQNKILTTCRGYGDYKGYWEFPGGKVELNESKEHALIREIKEELNAHISIDSFITTVEYDYPTFHVTLHCYLCQLIDDFELVEHLDFQWLDKDHLFDVNWLEADIEVLHQIKNYL
ncbi:MAG: (deoxy)nucleoside triphosphate pyrophosphohydrolase [Erysipelotrichaceae bacterium]